MLRQTFRVCRNEQIQPLLRNKPHGNALALGTSKRQLFGKNVSDFVDDAVERAVVIGGPLTDRLIDQSIENANVTFDKIDKKLKHDCDIVVTHKLGPITIQYNRTTCEK